VLVSLLKNFVPTCAHILSKWWTWHAYVGINKLRIPITIRPTIVLIKSSKDEGFHFYYAW
jgi:hypothetical protein